MSSFFEHSFTEPIWSIRFWGKPEKPKLWVETRGQHEAFWHSVDLDTKEVFLLGKAPDDYAQLNFQQGAENEAIFIKLQRSKNPGIESIQTYSLTPLKLLNEEKTRPINTENTFSFQVPQHYEESQSYFKDFQTFFQQQFNESIAKGIDYFEGEDKLLFSYYLYDNGWKNYLRVCNLAFDTILLEKIAEGDSIGYQTFTLLNEQLIFVQDKLKLKIYEKL
ncbi:hypothetical protein SKC37_02300 [Aquirufa sp. HETE-83D]|uniref:DUF4905 domain-containing protein n=1 Tax=Aquirufa esocilacus TaxID=3096513 RepID=A0ABW6DFK4_9BACT